ncbi:hypothetical protein MRB53_016594 [Persea americana]|uniref:Uncharacterized protein n=1 Tax=Persea americana TaxID=3435 RepID=A0ACC2M2R7_PERAE|nr:hypothetical protein MRB53_016594 [Persea americana]
MRRTPLGLHPSSPSSSPAQNAHLSIFLTTPTATITLSILPVWIASPPRRQTPNQGYQSQIRLKDGLGEFEFNFKSQYRQN